MPVLIFKEILLQQAKYRYQHCCWMVIVGLTWTGSAQAKRGGLMSTHAEDMLASVLKKTMETTGVEHSVSW